MDFITYARSKKYTNQAVMTGGDPEETKELIAEEVSKVVTTIQGPKGDPGKSAYQIALDNGFEGTEKQWLESLQTSVEEIKAYIDNQIGGTLNDTY